MRPRREGSGTGPDSANVCAVRRVGLVGDPRQLHAVEAGNPLAAIVRDGAPTAVIGEVQRQRDEDLKAVVESFARGEAGWGALRASGHFVFSEDIARSAAQDYLTRSREERERTLVLCGTNATREAINEQVRLGLRLEGALGPDVKVRTLRRQDLTREELRRPSSYAPGDIVVPQRDHGARRTPSALERGVEYRVVEVRGETVDLENRVTGERSSWEPSKAAGVHLYREERTTLAEGDRVVFRENSRDLGAVNGDRGTVTRIGDHDLTVHLDRGDREVTLDVDGGARLEHAYATTVHQAQGQTVDHVIIAGETGKLASAEQAYVSFSRARESAVVYTDSPNRLREAWGEWRGKENAMEHLDPPVDKVLEEGALGLGFGGEEVRAPAPGPSVPGKGEREAELPSL